MISVNRAKEIIQSYGGQAMAWPEKERQDVLHWLLDSKSLSNIQQQAIEVDGFIADYNQKMEALKDKTLDQLCADRVLANLPAQQKGIEQIAMRVISHCHVIKQKMTAPLLLVAATVVVAVLGLSNSFQLNENLVNDQYLTISEYMAVYVEDNYVAEDEVFIVDDEQLEILAFIEPQVMGENY